jgi:stage III sporulation protein AE
METGSHRRPVRAGAVGLALVLAFVVVAFLPGHGGAGRAMAATVAADSPLDLESEVGRQAGDLGLGEVERLLDELNREMQGDLPPLRVKDVITSLIKGEGPYTFRGFLAAVGSRLWREVAAGGGLLARLVILAILCGLLQNIQSAFASQEIGELAFGVCNLVLIVLAAGGFVVAMRVCQGIIDQLVDFMQAMLPVMITLLAGLGAVTTAGLFNPVLVVSMEFIAAIIRNVILPVIVCAACVDLVCRAFTRFKLTALVDLLRQTSIVATGVLLALFLGLVSAYGAMGAVFDGAALKAAKFAASNLIPFIGKVLADAVEVVLGSSLVLKNVVGVVGALAVVSFTVFPLLKVVSLVVVYRVAGAVVQPLGAGELVGSLNSVGNSLVLMSVVASAVAVMFLVTLAIVVGAATAAAAVR